jgi:hypothetical protein
MSANNCSFAFCFAKLVAFSNKNTGKSLAAIKLQLSWTELFTTQFALVESKLGSFEESNATVLAASESEVLRVVVDRPPCRNDVRLRRRSFIGGSRDRLSNVDTGRDDR